ncbi:hypothetical protein GIB67_036843 [Kingdonia uniflora]|uniref:UDENN domain-containing protein n=1 Tax=Kingdonia uniflora TaxID=39325 RepID=A0A7J7LX43_9MAGN|nr:hypothetical protein GIB67_036843 [Kingdonia uniflora]
MAGIFEYFVVCGIGPEIRTLDGNRGFHGSDFMYMPSLLDQFPPSNHSLYPPPPPQLPTCVLPAGVEFFSSGPLSSDASTFPRSYPIVLTEGDGSKIYVSCIAFRDPVSEDIAEAYRVPAKSFADKCICLVSRSPSFGVLRDALEELFILCFSPTGSRKDLVILKKGERLYIVLLKEKNSCGSDYILSNIVSEAILHYFDPFRVASGLKHEGEPWSPNYNLEARDHVVVVDLEYNRITTSEEIPPMPEPELSSLRGEIMRLLYPNVVGIDQMKVNLCSLWEQYPKAGSKLWGDEHDLQLRIIFLKFFASTLSGYRNFIESNATQVFNTQAFLKKRSRSTNQPPESMFLDSHGFLDYLERGIGSDSKANNLLDKLQDALGRGQNPISILPLPSSDPEIITISDPGIGISGSGAKYCYDRFPSNLRTEEQEERRKAILVAASGEYSGKRNPGSPSMPVGKDSKAESLSPRERAAERERMVLDIKVKLQGLWLRLLKLGATDDPLSSFEYGTILALIESDAEGIGGSGFVECIREHIHSGWLCQLTEEQFIAVKELLKTAISRATVRNDMSTVRDALEVSAEMFKKDSNNASDYVQRHLLSLSIWEELRSVTYVTIVTAQLIIVASHMAGLGLPDTDAWFMVESIAEKNNIGYKHFIKLRGFLSHIQQLRIGYWGISSIKVQSTASYGLPSPRPQDTADDSQQPAEASGVGRSWVQSMFSREATSRTNSFSRVRRWTTDNGALAASENMKNTASPRMQELAMAGQKKVQSSVRTLRGHTGAVTALHCVTRRDVWDLVVDREDAGFFISGSTDCTVKIWDPNARGSELRATLRGHTRTVRAISSDRGKVVSGSDDQSVLVWDKQTTQLLEELKGHDAQVSCVRMLSGERVLTSSHDGSVKMWDVRTDTCVATVGRCPGAVLCMEYDDSTGILAAAGRDGSIRMVGDTLLTGSDDWTARMWSVSRGTCDAVLACHAGPILCVEYSASDRGIFTGSADGLLRFWENEEGGIRCVKNVTTHTASILSIRAGENWLGVGAADNSMSLYHRPQERLGGISASPNSKMVGWQLYRTPQRTVAMVRCVASDLDRKRICSGGRNGLLRLWEATINI